MFACPYLSENITGSYFLDATGSQAYIGKDFTFGSTKLFDLKKWDYGAGINFGYLGKKHLYFRVRYQFCLTNLIPEGDSRNLVKPSSLQANIGYFIRRCNRGERHGGMSSPVGNHWRGLRKGRWSSRQSWRRPNGAVNY